MRNVLALTDSFLGQIYIKLSKTTYLSSSDLSIYRVFLAVFLLIFPFHYYWVGQLPDSFYQPWVLSFANLFNEYPDPAYFYITQAIFFLIVIFILLGIKTRTSLIILFLLVTINNSFVYAIGKIDHDRVLISLVILLLAFTNSGTRKALVPDKKIPKKVQDTSLVLLAIFICFGFFTAGYEKAFTWLDFDSSTSGIAAWFYPQYYNLGRHALLADSFKYIPYFLYEVIDITVVFLELCGIMFLLSGRKMWFLYLLILSFFHLSNTLFLNIDFVNHVPVFAIWLITPILNEKKWILILFLIPLLFSGLYASVVVWCIMLSIFFLNYKLSLRTT